LGGLATGCAPIAWTLEGESGRGLPTALGSSRAYPDLLDERHSPLRTHLAGRPLPLPPRAFHAHSAPQESLRAAKVSEREQRNETLVASSTEPRFGCVPVNARISVLGTQTRPRMTQITFGLSDVILMLVSRATRL